VETLLQAGLNNALSATFLAVVVACLGRVVTRRPAVLHCLWFLVLLKLVTPPLYQVAIPCPDPLRAIGEATRSRIAGRPDRADAPVPEALTRYESADLTQSSIEATLVQLGRDSSDISPESDRQVLALGRLSGWLRTGGIRLVETIWLVGTVMTLLISCWRIRRFQLLLNAAQPGSDEVQDWVDELSADVGLGRSPRVWWISGKLSPMLWALGRSPRLIIPIELWKSLDNRQRGTLLVHELAHLRRGDHHVRMFELVVTALYWWNPVLWWVRRALRDVEEQCCDAWVVWAFPDAAKSYAETLLETLDFLHQSDRVEPLLASGFGKVHHLRKRLTMIMNGNTPRSVSLWGALGSLSLAVLLLPFNASWAQKADDAAKVVVVVKTVDDTDKSADVTVTNESGGQRLVRETVSTFPENQVLTEVVRLEDASPETVVVKLDSVRSQITGDGKSEVHLELRTDGATYVIEADSLKAAIDKLNEQIKALSKKSPQSAQDKKKAEALDKAVKALGDTVKRVDAVKSTGEVKGQHKLKQIELEKLVEKLNRDGRQDIASKIVAEAEAKQAANVKQDQTRRTQKLAKAVDDLQQVRVVARLELDKASDDKKAADRAAIRKQVEKLSAELKEKRVELAAAQKRLSELEREGGNKSPKTATTVTRAPFVGVVTPTDPTQNRRLELHVDGGHQAIRGFVGKLPSSDQQRIDALEKTLQKLLEEVASLKKEQKLDTRTKGPDYRPSGSN
jgi:bla regulator protein BlaR1